MHQFLSHYTGCALLLVAPLVWSANPQAGQAVVVGGSQGQVTACFSCHGLDGAGDGSGAFPRLTGQPAFYLYKQLLDYASGARSNDIMSPIAQQMSEPQMQDVAAYYALARADLPPPPAPPAPAVLALGQKIAEDGLPERNVTACVWCHGANNGGHPPSFPALAGQYAAYTELQLLFWKQGLRRNDPMNVMREIAQQLDLNEIRALALYLESVRSEAAPPITEANE